MNEMNSRSGPPLGGVPDLGALGKPQQIAMTPAVIPLRAEGVNAQGFADVVTIVAMIREALREDVREIVREELQRLMEPANA